MKINCAKELKVQIASILNVNSSAIKVCKLEWDQEKGMIAAAITVNDVKHIKIIEAPEDLTKGTFTDTSE